MTYSPILQSQHLSKTYGSEGESKKVLDNISLDICPGELTCIMGKSGCGKSTLLRCLSGLEQPTTGTVFRTEGLTQAFVFQDPRLLPWKTVRENIALGLLHTNNVRENEDAITESLRLVRLPSAANMYPDQLSGGMAQRVGLARALARKPDILYLDEPFGALDALTRRQMQQELLDILAKQSITTLLVTHDVTEAVLLANRIVELRNGKIGHIWHIDLPFPRKSFSPEVSSFSEEILNTLLNS